MGEGGKVIPKEPAMTGLGGKIASKKPAITGKGGKITSKKSATTGMCGPSKKAAMAGSGRVPMGGSGMSGGRAPLSLSRVGIQQQLLMATFA